MNRVPERMASLDERLGDSGARLVEIVTVAPRPSLARGGLRAIDRRAVYALCYAGSPHARQARCVKMEDASRGNDGIAPASSQTLAGHAARIVLADHLDVVGHFEWRWNTTLFKSGAGFGRRELE